MKQFLFLFIMIFLISGCRQQEKTTLDDKISSHGELICVYKENRVNENTLYTSYYLFSFSDQGVLKGATNQEVIEFSKTNVDDLKERYKVALEESIKTYDNVKGVSVTKKLDDDKYSFTVKMDNNLMDESTKEDYLLNMDRINTYKEFTKRGYTCN